MSLPTTVITLSLARELLTTLDTCAANQYTKRSEFIRQAIVEKIRSYDHAPTSGIEGQVVNLLMTDKQLEDLRHALMVEHRRRLMAKIYQ